VTRFVVRLSRLFQSPAFSALSLPGLFALLRLPPHSDTIATPPYLRRPRSATPTCAVAVIRYASATFYRLAYGSISILHAALSDAIVHLALTMHETFRAYDDVACACALPSPAYTLASTSDKAYPDPPAASPQHREYSPLVSCRAVLRLQTLPYCFTRLPRIPILPMVASNIVLVHSSIRALSFVHNTYCIHAACNENTLNRHTKFPLPTKQL
jgi:hypothetical protein